MTPASVNEEPHTHALSGVSKHILSEGTYENDKNSSNCNNNNDRQKRKLDDLFDQETKCNSVSPTASAVPVVALQTLSIDEATGTDKTNHSLYNVPVIHFSAAATDLPAIGVTSNAALFTSVAADTITSADATTTIDTTPATTPATIVAVVTDDAAGCSSSVAAGCSVVMNSRSSAKAANNSVNSIQDTNAFLPSPKDKTTTESTALSTAAGSPCETTATTISTIAVATTPATATTQAAVEQQQEDQPNNPPRKKVRDEDAYFAISGAIDGLTEVLDCSDSNPDNWKLETIVIEVKNRMHRIGASPPFYDQVQLVVYMQMLGCRHGELIEYLKTRSETISDSKPSKKTLSERSISIDTPHRKTSTEKEMIESQQLSIPPLETITPFSSTFLEPSQETIGISDVNFDSDLPNIGALPQEAEGASDLQSVLPPLTLISSMSVTVNEPSKCERLSESSSNGTSTICVIPHSPKGLLSDFRRDSTFDSRHGICESEKQKSDVSDCGTNGTSSKTKLSPALEDDVVILSCSGPTFTNNVSDVLKTDRKSKPAEKHKNNSCVDMNMSVFRVSMAGTHEKGWREVLVPKLYEFAQMIYELRADDLLRYQFLMGFSNREA